MGELRDRRRGRAPGGSPTTGQLSTPSARRSPRGDVYQVNLVQHLSASFAGSPSALAARLAPLHNRTTRRSVTAPGGRSTVTAGRSSPPRPSSSSRRGGRRIRTRPIKGTRPLGRRAELLASRKDAAEHVMIVDLERNDLSRVCVHGTRAVARADACRVARRRRAPRLDGRGRAATRRRPGGDPRGDLPRRVGHGCAEDRRARPDRGARAGRPRRVDGCARPRPRDG